MSRIASNTGWATLVDGLRRTFRRHRNLAELGRLDRHLLDDIGVAEATPPPDAGRGVGRHRITPEHRDGLMHRVR